MQIRQAPLIKCEKLLFSDNPALGGLDTLYEHRTSLSLVKLYKSAMFLV